MCILKLVLDIVNSVFGWIPDIFERILEWVLPIVQEFEWVVQMQGAVKRNVTILERKKYIYINVFYEAKMAYKTKQEVTP